MVADTAEAPRRRACLRWSQWENDEGAVLDLVLSYASPRDAQPDLRKLSVDAKILTRDRLKEIGVIAGKTPRVTSRKPAVMNVVIVEPDLESLVEPREAVGPN
jgi:hypothetical protein